MEELLSKVRALLVLGDSDMTASLVIDVVARGLGKLGGRPRKDEEATASSKRKNVSESQRYRIFERDGFTCRYCGGTAVTGAVLTVDHVTPVALGGGNEDENLRTACDDCNRGKGDRKPVTELPKPVPGTGKPVSSETVSVSPAPPSDPGSSLLLRADPERAISPPLLVFPCDGEPREFGLAEELRKEHAEAFPSLNVMGEYRKALAWINASPQNRKTARGMPKFLFGWLGRAQNSGAARANNLPPTVPIIKPQPVEKYLDQRDRCEFHREAGNDAIRAPEAVSWCRRCQRLTPRAAGGAR